MKSTVALLLVFSCNALMVARFEAGLKQARESARALAKAAP